MMENMKKYATQTLVLVINLALVGGGVSYFKKEQDQKNAVKELASDISQADVASTVDPAIQEAAQKAQELQQIIDKNSADKVGTVATAPKKVPVQVPKTVTQTIPGGTKTVSVSTPKSSSTSSSSTPAKTTKKS